ncbi:hypothetical protein HGRIS_007739 [Hohenbuehelia grisea]|uniref:GYF domain-containing protein n=1 Tax=Hohenbuehelia grisea TaxID=104357 RepID=A0ABR3J5S7_9AGAR
MSAAPDSVANDNDSEHRPQSTRASNRLSGFFTSLIHRRDNTPTIHEEQDSRASTPPPPRSVTPPPQLPPPTLHELGLALSVITDSLSPSHFSASPSSGTFLAPHYLLLCHAQGLDVLPLVSPPAPQPYALVRRVSFKSVVVMEHRGVLVAIAGRRDGVRVYALEEVRRAVEWRIEVEVRRERERLRREAAKKTSLAGLDIIAVGTDRASGEKPAKQSLSTPPDSVIRGKLTRRNSHTPSVVSPAPTIATVPPTPLIPRRPTTRSKKRPRTSPIVPGIPTSSPEPLGHPPPYSSPPESSDNSPPRLRGSPSLISLRARGRSGSVSNVLAGPTFSRRSNPATSKDLDAKPDWAEASDDEAIDIVAAGPSGSQALDERTSAAAAASSSPSSSPPDRSGTLRRNRPANLDLSLARPSTHAPPPAPEPSPAPTLATLRQTLSISPSAREARLPSETTLQTSPQPAPTPLPDDSNDEDEHDGEISLAQALFESRRPELPPIGSRQEQQPILITQSHPVATGDDEPSSPRTSDAHSHISAHSRAATEPQPLPERSRRRRWSVLLASTLLPSSTPPMSSASSPALAPSSSPAPARSARHSPSSQSLDSRLRQSPSPMPPPDVPPLPNTTPPQTQSNPGRHLRLIPRAITNAIRDHWSRDLTELNGNRQPRRSRTTDSEQTARLPPSSPHAPPPKLEYVKLPGTKGALMIKAVETARKSFLAILCGENGEKVELFAGTYRSALGLSRTFILPDSPRSLELQLQGDDLVEVFLVFSQNVFGLEPATVRVREVRIGRAERRAARRRARELRGGEAASVNEADAGADEDTNVNVSIGVSVTVEPRNRGPDSAAADTPAFIASQHPDQDQDADQQADAAPTPPNEPAVSSEAGTGGASAAGSGAGTGVNTPAQHAEEVVALATVQMGPYTTFQQLSFAPRFPTAAIADEYIIPPTYRDFLQYRSEHEPDAPLAADAPSGSGTDASGSESGSNSGNGTTASAVPVPQDLAQIQFSPPGLPVPTPIAPSKWYYRDPKSVVHGPWKASLMQAWYKDGLLPLDLPVRREEDTEYILLKDLRLQSVDPTHPFRTPNTAPSPTAPVTITDPSKPLLHPISLLSQPRHFGPPALFYSSRGGHSTAIVDARGRPVLKGRFVWTADADASTSSVDGTEGKGVLGPRRMGDIRRLEAFDVRDRAVLVAMRQGGIEAVDLSDALLRPADASRTVLPHFDPPPSNINRRGPFVWRIGTPVGTSTRGLGTVIGGKRPGSAPHVHSLGGVNRRSTALGSSALARSPAAAKGEFGGGEHEGSGVDVGDEMLFLGRKDDEVYICERNAATFRILRLGPEVA